jgi:hypothetical protein
MAKKESKFGLGSYAGYKPGISGTGTVVSQRGSVDNKNSHFGNRDFKNGQFVTKKYADSHKSTTQKESIPNPGHGDIGNK